MIETLRALGQGSGIQTLMSTPWGWPAAESLHFLGLSLLIGTVGMFDLRMLGLGRDIPLRALHGLVPWGVAGYGLNVVTGALFLVSAPDQYVHNPAFQLKLALMAVAGLNVLVFYRFVFRRAPLTADVPVPLGARVAAGISLLCWVGVITCGRLITYYRPPYHWCFWC